MNVVVSGAGGLIGSMLCDALDARGDDLMALTRRRPTASNPRVLHWNPMSEPAPGLSGADAVIHLAGEPIAGRWTAAKKRRIMDSRVVGTRNIVAGIADADPKPQTFICASAIGYYGDRGDEELDESSPPGDDFLARVCQAWEAEAAKAVCPRVVTLRIGLLLDRSGGILQQFERLFKAGIGGPLGNGRQWMSWIHRDDLTRLFLFVLDKPDIVGALNAASPNPVRNREFAAAFGKVLHRPSFLRTSKLALKIMFGELADAVFAGQRVRPTKALAAGFEFKHAEIDEALASLYN